MSHPNQLFFRGLLALVDQPSTKAPAGARGHRITISREAVEGSLPSLIGMGVNYAPRFDRHDTRRKVGVITEASVLGCELRIRGYIFANDFPEVAQLLPKSGQISAAKSDAPGLSYEIYDARVYDMRSHIWVVNQFIFTGAAIIKQKHAAYAGTWIEAE